MESIQEHPQQAGKILIGYSRGLVILWALSTRQAEQLFLGKQVAILYSFFSAQIVINYYKFQKYFLVKLVNSVSEMYLLSFLFLPV